MTHACEALQPGGRCEESQHTPGCQGKACKDSEEEELDGTHQKTVVGVPCVVGILRVSLYSSVGLTLAIYTPSWP